MRGASIQMRWAMKLISMVLGILFVVTVAGVVGRASAASNAPAVGAAAPDFTRERQSKIVQIPVGVREQDDLRSGNHAGRATVTKPRRWPIAMRRRGRVRPFGPRTSTS